MTRAGYEFLGWSTDKNETTAQYHIGDTIASKKSVTLYSVWAEQKSKPVYRLYNSVSGEHIYTPDEEEKNVLSAAADWNYEGVAWNSAASGIPVYRLYNPVLGNHLYTTDTNEVSVLTSQQGWVADFNGAPLFNSNGDRPVYRLYNQGLRGMHHLTTDKNEYDVLVQYGWTQEGIAFRAM